MNNKKSQMVEIDLAKIVSADVLAKLYYLCKKRKLKFPDGIVLLLQEVSEPRKVAKNAKPCCRSQSVAPTARVRTAATRTFSRPKKVR